MFDCTTTARRRVATLAPILLAALLVIPASATALSDPSVTELFKPGAGNYGTDVITFTVTNPSDSSVGEIVGFVVESAPPADTFPPVGWKGMGLSVDLWNTNMNVAYFGMNTPEKSITWSQFFGRINYPFPSSDNSAITSTGFYLDFGYDNVNIPTFSFLNSYAAISPGDSAAVFNIEVGGPMSSYVLAHVNNAGPGFDTNGFSTFNGETTIIPEPSTAALLGLGLLGALATVRRFPRH